MPRETETVLFGDPEKPGLYSILLRIAPHTRIPALSHPDNRIATVLGGTWRVGYGDAYAADRLRTLPPGSVCSEPPGTNHFGETGAEEVVVQITGYGPSGTTYVNPADDARSRPWNVEP